MLAADWSTLHDKGPFSLLFLDSGEPADVGVDAVVDLVEPGGIVVLDDFTPCESWPPIFIGRVDTLREEWLTDERFTAVEVMVAPDARDSSPPSADRPPLDSQPSNVRAPARPSLLGRAGALTGGAGQSAVTTVTAPVSPYVT